MAFKVFRGPETTDNLSLVPARVQLNPLESSWSASQVSFRFVIPAGGQGRSTIDLSFEAEDFKKIAQAMMDVDADGAIRAFGSAMLKGSTAQDEVTFIDSLGDGNQ